MTDTDPLVALWTAVIAQAIDYATGHVPGYSHRARGRRVRIQLAQEWCFSEHGPEAERRRLVLSSLGIDERAFQERVRRAIRTAA